jgi:riboflavin kinase/FMN adenylyltransferase
MQVWSEGRESGELFHHGVVTVGNFDGLHLGHQALFKKAREAGQPRVLITFDPHPLQVLRPEQHLKRLFPREDLIEQLPKYGVDLLVVVPFDRKFARRSASDFLQEFLANRFKAKHIVAGYDFAFGNRREGTLQVLQDWAKERDITVDVVPPLEVAGQTISSRRIREVLVQGDVATAEQLLGRAFYLRGEVVSGAGRGSKIGIPTLNQRAVNETLPKNGVYASQVSFAGRMWSSVTNIGINPTFAGHEIKVETHVIGEKVDWHGQSIDVHLRQRLREERKFPNVKSLTEQIQTDISEALSALGKGQ